MADRPKDKRRSGTAEGGSREDRLRAALRANLARRKAQARARQDQNAQDDDQQTGSTDTGKDDS